MEIAVLADIHSNYIALERCVEYALDRGIGSFLFLGDYLGEMAYPERTMELLRKYNEKYDCVFIKGNKEGYWLQYRDRGEQGWAEYSSTTGALYYAYRRLTEEDMAFFHSLPIARKVQYGDLPELTVCHGSPTNVREIMLSGSQESRKILEESESDYILHGHTHIQGKTEHMGKLALNPGSVGLALQAGGLAQFAILHGEGGCWREEFISLDYDRERVTRELYESGLYERAPYWCAITEKLLSGEAVDHAGTLERAMELCRADTGVCNWPDIPEKYWEQAFAEAK